MDGTLFRGHWFNWDVKVNPRKLPGLSGSTRTPVEIRLLPLFTVASGLFCIAEQLRAYSCHGDPLCMLVRCFDDCVLVGVFQIDTFLDHCCEIFNGIKFKSLGAFNEKILIEIN